MRLVILPKTVRKPPAPSALALALAVVLGLVACTEPPPPPPEVMMERDEAAAPFLGTWDLVDWRIVEPEGEVIFPYGEDARGQIVYTDDGRMSAHLMGLPDPESGPDGGSGSPRSDGEDGGAREDGPFQSFSYWGSFTVDPAAETVTHHVIGSSSRSWVGSDQVRGFEFLGEDRVVLTAPRTLPDGSTGAPQRLTWVRVR